jgi:predicted TIM-barrel fold metal-dependent hydrolase
VIDAHVRHRELGRFRYPWLDAPEFAALRTDYRPADYRADADGVPLEGWVHIQAEVDHDEDPVAETACVAELADDAVSRSRVDPRGHPTRRRPGRSAVAGGIPHPGRPRTVVRRGGPACSAASLLGLPRDECAVRSIVDELVDLFGPRRCMIGSNFPVDALPDHDRQSPGAL